VLFRCGFDLSTGVDAVRRGRVGLLVNAASAAFYGVRVTGLRPVAEAEGTVDSPEEAS